MFGAKYSRLKFWIISICLFIPAVIINVFVRALENSENNQNSLIVFFIINFIIVILWLNTLANRIRDYGSNPWISLWAFIPFGNLFLAFFYGVKRYKTKKIVNSNNENSYTKSDYNYSKDSTGEIQSTINEYKEKHNLQEKQMESDTKINIKEDEVDENVMLKIEEGHKMYCRECGIENSNEDVKCKNCNTVLNTNLPLDGTERVKIIIASLLFLTPILWLAGIIAIASFYIMKKDKIFTSMTNARKYIKIYFIVSVLIGIVIVIVNIIHDIYYASLDNVLILFYLSFGFGIPILGKILMIIYDNLFFKPLSNHKDWIINNGLFEDKKNSQDSKVNVVGRDNLSSYSVADEILKWNSLLEKELITEEEFQKAKEKILKEKID